MRKAFDGEKSFDFLDDLPSFIDADSDTSFLGYPGDWWTVTPSGNPHLDLANGEQLAGEAIRYAKQCGNAMVIALPVLQMIEKARANQAELTPIEVGFVTRVAYTAKLGAMD